MQSQVPRKWYQKICRFKRKTKGQEAAKNSEIGTYVKLVIKPLRIFQFLVVLLIFVLVVYTILLADSNLSSVICILILVLSGAYTFVLAIDSICQFCGEELHSIPMFIFSFLGTIFFGLVGIFLILVHNVTIPWYVLTIACLSLLSCVLFVIRVSIILAFWKRQCNLCKQCCYSKQAEALLQRNICHPLCTETVKYDLTTSVSSVRVPSGDEGAIPDHSYRKVAYGHRRQYVDCPTSARQLAFVDVANVQTEHRAMCNIQSQTKQDVKESPVQTVSRCELCNRQMQFFSSTSAMVPTDQQTPCAPCPALVQLLRGTPCCPGCRCVTGIIQVPQQSQQQQTQRHEKSKQDKEADKEQTHAADEKSYEMLTSGEYSPQDQQLKGVSGTITKLTLASYCVTPKTTDISCQTTTETTKKTGEPVEPKKVRVSFSNKGKQDAKKKSDMLIPEKETSKATNNTAKKALRPAKKTPESSTEKPVESFAEKQKSSAEKQVESSAEKQVESSAKKQKSSPEKEESAEKEVSEIPTEKAVNSPVEQPEKSSVEKPVEPATQKAPESIAEDAEKDSDKSSDPAMVISEQKKLIPPPRQVAEIIDRLQEMEGTKGESPMMPQSADILDSTVSQRETKSVVIGEGKAVTISQPSTTGNGQETEKEDEPRTDEKRRASTLDAKTNHPDSEEVSLISYESSKLSVNQKEKMKGENDKPKSDDSTAKEERAQETDSTTKPHMGTQTAEASTANNRNKRTYGLRKKNKVEPAEMTYTDTDVQTFDYADNTADTEKLFAEKQGGSNEEKIVNICPACKRLQIPTMSSSFQYYSVYKDKRGRLYCEYCATPNSIKVLHKKDEGRRLKCAGCGNILRVKSSQSTRNKSDNCPNCGQTQTPVSA